jgi:hypothetical protein
VGWCSDERDLKSSDDSVIQQAGEDGLSDLEGRKTVTVLGGLRTNGRPSDNDECPNHPACRDDPDMLEGHSSLSGV